MSVIAYRAVQLHEGFRLVAWQRTYDAWPFYLLGFWNPAQLATLLPQQQSQSFAGHGLELMVTFNH